MSGSRDNDPDLEPREDAEAGEARTLIRGQTASAAEPNDDATLLRDGPGQPEPNDDATLLRQPSDSHTPNNDETLLSSREPEANDDETIVRKETAEPDDAATLLRPRSENASDEGEAETIVRGRRDVDAGSASEDAATILRGPASDAAGEEATILRAPSSDSATILREPGDDGATILRGSDGDDDDATIINGDGFDDDDDRTIINDDYGDDATVIGPGGDGQDTTYIASVGKQQRPRGNTEAGRLLKNRFVLEEKIGSGGMGDVYKALDLRQQEAQERDPYIAIKLLNESFARHKDAFLSLQRETSRTRGIPHPNIMAVYDFDREGDTVFMSMELLDGKPLDDFLKEHPEGVSIEDAWTIIDGICEGLHRAHEAGIVHSDFKPGNIFYTKDKTAKVFDFGIARAVSNPNELEADGEKTVFDAGSLGALTPTYASYEMLKGMEPSKSDDVYAVALVAYELFMGKHPYDRVPADKALERGLTPKPVPFLKRRHWKALKKALELKGENRTQTIREFHDGIFSEDPPYFRYAAVASVLIGSISFAAYQTLNVVEKPAELVEFEDAIAGAEVVLNTIGNPQWDSSLWHDNLSTALIRWRWAAQNIRENPEWVEEWDLNPEDGLNRRVEQILTTYLTEIRRLRGDAQGYEAAKRDEYGVEQALEHLQDAKSYMDKVVQYYRFADPTAVDQELKRLEVRLDIRTEQLAKIEEAERIAEEQRLADEAAAKAAEEQRIFEENRLRTYEGYLAELKEILKCKGQMPDEDLDRFGVLLTSMQNEWPEAYQHHYSTIIDYTASCISERIGLVAPDEARKVQARVVNYLPGEQKIASIVIEDKDPCDDRKLVGRGDSSQRWCADRLLEGGEGPELVVIPPFSLDETKYAISRAEIRVGEYNAFCQKTGCEQIQNMASSLPATNLSISQARAYADWLSEQSGQTYRLPTDTEWAWAATTDEAEAIDQNINCTVDSRGVRLGEKLLSVVSGKSNKWGLFNFVGNAREWALTSGGDLVALGGAHTDPRNECRIEKRVAHQGDADPVTGFRLVREIQKNERFSRDSDLAASSGD